MEFNIASNVTICSFSMNNVLFVFRVADKVRRVGTIGKVMGKLPFHVAVVCLKSIIQFGKNVKLLKHPNLQG